MLNTDFNPPADPWALFAEWYALAQKHEPALPEAMDLATAGSDGMPSVRQVLMKSYGDDGFTFFTNTHSKKGEQLKQNPKAGLCWYWKSLGLQIRAEGLVTRVSDTEADAYFATRARSSQIGAWVSQQSRVLDSRAEMERCMQEMEKEYHGKTVPRPPYWGGYRLMPLLIEFWQERPHRMHNRVVYRRAYYKGPWHMERLYP